MAPDATTAATADDTLVDDEELARLAMAGDPEAPLPPDAVPWSPDRDGADLLPDWYMPAPAGTPLQGWRRAVAWLIVGAALAVVASGLCNTYGELVVA